MKKLFSLLISFLPIYTLFAQYDPDAGKVSSYTDNAIITQSSGNNLNYCTDSNNNTFWESAACLPEGFISRAYLNVFHKDNPQRLISQTGPLFDGDVNTQQEFKKASTNGKYLLEIDFNSSSYIRILSLKAQLSAPIRVSLKSKKNAVFAGIILPEANYKLQNLRVAENYLFESMILESDQPFGIFELACLSDFPYEYISFDFKAIKPVQQVWSRHMSGNNVQNTSIEISNDGKNWQKIAELNPQAVPLLPTILDKVYNTQFLRIRFDLSLEDYGKALLWEIKIYDEFGPFGPPQTFQPNASKLVDRMGINGIWGWGYNTYSDNLPENSGPATFRKVAGNARNYHEFLWDITQPGQRSDYNKMSKGEGTQASWWLNWDREYAVWKKNGFQIAASIQFKYETVPESAWKNPYQDAYNFGFDFANHFGPSKGNNSLHFVEIGNEPWDYSLGFYPQILNGMLKGMKDADQKLSVIPAAFQATYRHFDGTEYNNYIGDNLNINSLTQLDGLNGHFYAYTFNKDGNRISVHPEDPRSGLKACRNLLKFRDVNLPGKAVYVTEYGYDSESSSEDCTHDVCVSESQQAAWGLRAALLLLRNGVQEAYWYFFANENTASFLHTRSGLTSSINTGFKPKQSFVAFRQFVELLGASQLQKIMLENEDVYCYLFENKSTAKRYALAWRPVGGNPNDTKPVKLAFPNTPLRSFLLDGNAKNKWIELNFKNSTQTFLLCGFPMVIEY